MWGAELMMRPPASRSRGKESRGPGFVDFFLNSLSVLGIIAPEDRGVRFGEGLKLQGHHRILDIMFAVAIGSLLRIHSVKLLYLKLNTKYLGR